LFVLSLLFELSSASAYESVRSQEITQCLPGEIVTWGDGRDRAASGLPLKFTYVHSGAPPWFAETPVSGMVEKGVAEWSNCGVPAMFVGRGIGAKNVIRVGWDERGSGGNFGLANLGQRTLSLSPKAFELLKTKNPSYDSRQTLQMVISHEMGHFFGMMAHSRRCVDVLSYYDNGKGEKCSSRDPSWMTVVQEYRHLLPTACDIERCRKINGQPPLPGGRLPGR
jgi:hypothetical protein